MLASLPVPPPEGACVLTGCIADAPRTEGGFTYATLYDAACNGDSVRGRIQIRFPAEKAKGLKCGDIISSEAALRIPQKQAGSFDARAYYLSMGITALAYSRNAPSVRAHRIDLRYRLCSLRTRIAAVLDAAFGTEAPLARALLLNDKALLPEAAYAAFRDAGVAQKESWSPTENRLAGAASRSTSKASASAEAMSYRRRKSGAPSAERDMTDARTSDGGKPARTQ